MSDISIVRSATAQQFLILANEVARDTRLSFKARGLHHYLLSLPPNWHTTMKQLTEENPEGREALRGAMKELITLGYVIRQRHQDERGYWRTSLTVYDTAQPPADGIPAYGFPSAGKPSRNKKDGSEEVLNDDEGLPGKRAKTQAESSPPAREGCQDHGQDSADGCQPCLEYIVRAVGEWLRRDHNLSLDGNMFRQVLLEVGVEAYASWSDSGQDVEEWEEKVFGKAKSAGYFIQAVRWAVPQFVLNRSVAAGSSQIVSEGSGNE